MFKRIISFFVIICLFVSSSSYVIAQESDDEIIYDNEGIQVGVQTYPNGDTYYKAYEKIIMNQVYTLKMMEICI